MAGRKEYSMDFMLNAALNGNFKGTFSSAQAEFAKLGSEIRDLGRMQSDISSYQKQQAAVTNTAGDRGDGRLYRRPGTGAGQAGAAHPGHRNRFGAAEAAA